MSTATAQPTLSTGSSVNPAAAKTTGPKLKQETIDQAARLKAEMEHAATTNTVNYKSPAAIDKELESLGTSREKLGTLMVGLHNLSASHTLASGQVAHEVWSEQKAEDRGPIVAPVNFWEGQSITVTHNPVSVERIPGQSATVEVYGQANVQQVTTVGRNNGQMAASRQELRNLNAAKFGPK